MNETQRQAYLRAMDIQPYYPRQLLPAAKPSPAYAFTAPALSAVPAAAAAAPVVQEPSVPSARPTPRRRAAATPVADAVAAPRSAPPAEPASEPDTLRFRLYYYRISATLAVIDEAPHQQERGAAGAAGSLLQAILQALGVADAPLELVPESFNWPLAEGMTMRNAPAVEAQKALQGFIAMRQQTDRFENLIIFAAQIEDLVRGSADQSERDYIAADASHRVTLTHSLQSMLAYPQLKREVWTHLQALRHRLADSAGAAGA